MASPRSPRAKSPAVAWWCASADPAEPIAAILEAAKGEGFLGPGPVADHITHAEALARLLPQPERFLDLGSGAGIPGLVLATEWPRTRGVLLDRRERSGAFLRSVVDELGLSDRVGVLVAIAEEAARSEDLRATFDLVVARGFGPPAVTAECARAFLKPHGLLAVTEPPGGDKDRWPATHLTELGFAAARLVSEADTHAAILEAQGPPDDRWPRRQGTPQRRPLW